MYHKPNKTQFSCFSVMLPSVKFKQHICILKFIYHQFFKLISNELNSVLLLFFCLIFVVGFSITARFLGSLFLFVCLFVCVHMCVCVACVRAFFFFFLGGQFLKKKI